MRAYELVGEVDEQHRLHLDVPADIPAGVVHVTMRVDKNAHAESSSSGKQENDDLLALVEACRMDTGIEDLAHQNDHYFRGTLKTPDWNGS